MELIFELNAGNSYDEDQRGLRGLDAGLSFHWSCQQKKPLINSDACPGVSYSRTGQPSLIVSYIAESTTSIFTVEITDASKSRRVTKQVTLKTLGMNSPQVNIIGINELLKFDIAESVSFKSEFIIKGDAIATWTVDPPIDNFDNLLKNKQSSKDLSLIHI